ncbi:endonuclease/exonuclease/phosphatase family protein [Saccharicrinis aurantiacus]|uniref:endonuclease/exonuclease/phosphatase family protein n=1 Tax=Saccharicrinis aurantiacus TaxID=1849719 RepID=UPI0008398C88|nr:endonuclease/exonuclease/phosphatase family protein [Saccharicrinis aurantiacus]
MSRKNIIIILLVCAFIQVHAQLSVMSFNIKFDTANDGDNSWDFRKSEVVDLLSFYHPDFFGLQEAVNNQVDFINHQLEAYNYIGIGREGAESVSEGVQIFYDTIKYKLIDTNTFWLSETPNELSKGWDASYYRIATYGSFADRRSGDTLHILNCHLDNDGKLARKEAVKLIVKTLDNYQIENQKVIIMGDFNCTEDDKPYSIINKEFDDAMKLSVRKPYGPIGTWNAYDTESIVNRRIDYIFCKGFKVNTYRHIDDRRANNLYPSDHLPVLTELE